VKPPFSDSSGVLWMGPELPKYEGTEILEIPGRHPLFPEIPNLRSYLPSLPTISLQDRKFRKNSVIFVFRNLRKFKPEFLSFIIILIPFLRDIVECRCLFLPEQSAGCNKDKLQYQKIYQVP